MNIKLDENLPVELVDLLSSSGHDVHTVSGEGLIGRDDDVIFAAASTEKRLLITQDLDFSDVRLFEPGTHSGIVLVRMHDPNRRKLMDKMRQMLATQNIELWTGCFIVRGDVRLRVIRP